MRARPSSTRRESWSSLHSRPGSRNPKFKLPLAPATQCTPKHKRLRPKNSLAQISPPQSGSHSKPQSAAQGQFPGRDRYKGRQRSSSFSGCLVLQRNAAASLSPSHLWHAPRGHDDDDGMQRAGSSPRPNRLFVWLCIYFYKFFYSIYIQT